MKSRKNLDKTEFAKRIQEVTISKQDGEWMAKYRNFTGFGKTKEKAYYELCVLLSLVVNALGDAMLIDELIEEITALKERVRELEKQNICYETDVSDSYQKDIDSLKSKLTLATEALEEVAIVHNSEMQARLREKARQALNKINRTK